MNTPKLSPEEAETVRLLSQTEQFQARVAVVEKAAADLEAANADLERKFQQLRHDIEQFKRDAGLA
jgi:hypothetical protein